MTDNHRYLLSMLLTVLIVSVSVFVIHRFIPSLLWAGIIMMMTYPVYQKWHQISRCSPLWSAFGFTAFVSVIIIIPLLWLITVLVQEAQIFVSYLMTVNQHGISPPEALTSLPVIGIDIETYLMKHFSHPNGLKYYLSQLNTDISAISYYAKAIGVSLFHRSVQIGFTLLSLFFFYRDGDVLINQINKVGENCLGERWSHFAFQLPKALQGTVNGTVLVGIGVGVIMGLIYWILGFPAPTLAGFFTALAAMIPFAVPIVFIAVALFIWLSGALLKAIILLIIGTVVMFIADHFVKPVLIGGTTELHFLAVLFGLLGGVETLGLIGLFLGPMVMVLFMTLWRELQCPDSEL